MRPTHGKWAAMNGSLEIADIRAVGPNRTASAPIPTAGGKSLTDLMSTMTVGANGVLAKVDEEVRTADEDSTVTFSASQRGKHFAHRARPAIRTPSRGTPLGSLVSP